ncbi:MAG: hypothetical protein GWN61_07300, partial [candidate division Zixibacteria bacterium]|nr:hypothetical protein [candidate division Zixibacteria bacterium]NIS45811.1 hypothetical protein [candidate division Zixibacteria bacterium]NIU13930.1 hypothetical protein [candidate division Zixibacteria bacterium]NIV05982.1 hypothetical protein [candidate division Zixibacteria bacterium]
TRDRSIEHSQAIEDILSALEIPPDPDEEDSQLEKGQILSEDQDPLPAYEIPRTNRDFSQAARSRQPQNNRIPLIQLDYCGMLVTRLPEHGINRYLEL